MIRPEKISDRYESEKGNKFMEYISKEMMYSRGSTYDKARSRNNVLFSPFRVAFSQTAVKSNPIKVSTELKCTPSPNLSNNEEAPVS